MKNVLATCAMFALCFALTGAQAQERTGDAALGAVSGGVIFGPAGAIAGGIVGYIKGPSIAHAWGLHGHRYRRYSRRRAY
jgi:hypothetical protein